MMIDFARQPSQCPRSPQRFIAAVAGLFLALGATRAHAQLATGAASAQVTEESFSPDPSARPVFEAGRRAYAEGRYRDAAEVFEQVYVMTGHRFMLLNMANAYARAGETAKAASSLRRYLALTENPSPELKQRLADLELQEAAQAQAVAAAAVPAPPPAPVAQPVQAKEQDSGLIAGRTWTWVALGASVAAGTAATVMWLNASERYDNLSDGCGRQAGCSEAQISSVEGGVTATNALLGVSLGALAAAVALWVIEAPDAAAERTPITTAVGPQSAQLMLHGSF